MIVDYALSVIEHAIPYTYREAEINSEYKMWKEATLEESLHKNDTSKSSELLNEKKANGCKWMYAKK